MDVTNFKRRLRTMTLQGLYQACDRHTTAYHRLIETKPALARSHEVKLLDCVHAAFEKRGLQVQAPKPMSRARRTLLAKIAHQALLK